MQLSVSVMAPHLQTEGIHDGDRQRLLCDGWGETEGLLLQLMGPAAQQALLVAVRSNAGAGRAAFPRHHIQVLQDAVEHAVVEDQLRRKGCGGRRVMGPLAG